MEWAPSLELWFWTFIGVLMLVAVIGAIAAIKGNGKGDT